MANSLRRRPFVLKHQTRAEQQHVDPLGKVDSLKRPDEGEFCLDNLERPRLLDRTCKSSQQLKSQTGILLLRYARVIDTF